MPKFHPVSPQVDLPAMEQDVLRFWNRPTCSARRRSRPRTGRATSSTKDRRRPTAGPASITCWRAPSRTSSRATRPCTAIYVPRKGGWDTHGLPVELEVEKQLGFSGKKAIEEYGIAAFNQKCRESVFDYVDEWEQLTERIGYWVDLHDRLRHAAQRLRRIAVVDPEAVLGPRADLPGLQGRALLPALRHAAEQPRAGAGLQGRHEGPQRLCQVPAAATSPAHVPPGLDDHAVDAARQRGAGGAARTSTTCWSSTSDDKLWLAEALVGKVFGEPREP